MASGKGQTLSDEVIDWFLGPGTPTRPSATNALRLALCTTTNPSATSAATAATVSGDYAAGGDLVPFNAASSGSATGPTSAITYTPAGTSWTVTGIIIHNAGTAHPTAAQIVYFDDAFDVTVGDGVTLQIDAAGITVSET